MFHSLTHHPHLTQPQHRALPGLANTDLGRLADAVLGRPLRDCAAAFNFGSLFHTATLEPEEFDALPATTDRTELTARANALALARAVRRQRYPRHVLYRGAAEQSYTATHAATGLLVKVRPDLLIDSPQRRRRTLIDFKTTSCRDRAQFLITIEEYAYDRQAAFYADVLGAQRVVLIAVQKKAPFAVWTHELTPEQMEAGRKKYQRLLREAARTAIPEPTETATLSR
jgi:hypothetical protein